MSIETELQKIIIRCIMSEKNCTDWKEYTDKIYDNLCRIEPKTIYGYLPCQRKLHLTLPKMRTIMHNFITINNNIFIETNYDQYEAKEGHSVTFNDRCHFIEKCVVILKNKQRQP